MTTSREEHPTGNVPASSVATVAQVFDGEVMPDAQSAQFSQRFAQSETRTRRWHVGQAVEAAWRSDSLVRAVSGRLPSSAGPT